MGLSRHDEKKGGGVVQNARLCRVVGRLIRVRVWLYMAARRKALVEVT